jgi:hypothetical protein
MASLEGTVKKSVFLIMLITVAMSYSSYASADEDDYYDRDDGYRNFQLRGGYYREEIIYYPQPQVQYYSPPPSVTYYPPQPQPNAYYDQRSPQGLVGGMLGSAIGYEIGQGNPIGAGLGAAVGSYMGNGW